MFRPEEDQPNANHVAVLSYAAWKRLFGADPQVLSRKIELNRVAYQIVGVAGPDFQWPAQVDLWVPIGLPPNRFTEDNRFNENFFAAARMKPGVSVSQANSWMNVLADRVRNNGTRGGAYARDAAWGMAALPMADYVLGDNKKFMLILMVAVAFVLLIACANIAGLMLARASGRAKEIAVRAALGAGHWDLVRQTITETAVIVFAGALIGLDLTYTGVRSLLLLAPESLASSLTIHIGSSRITVHRGSRHRRGPSVRRGSGLADCAHRPA